MGGFFWPAGIATAPKNHKKIKGSA